MRNRVALVCFVASVAFLQALLSAQAFEAVSIKLPEDGKPGRGLSSSPRPSARRHGRG